jgi:hypothetical protein
VADTSAAAHSRRRVHFAGGSVMTVAIPWGDLATAYISTGIPRNLCQHTAHRGDRQPRAQLGAAVARLGPRPEGAAPACRP